MSPDPNEAVHIHTATARVDADLIVSMLQAHGIRTFQKGTGSEVFTEAGAIGQMTRAPGPLNDIRIMVHPDDEMEARRILAAGAETPEVEEAGSGSGGWALDPTKRRRAMKVVALVLLVPIVYGVVVGALEVARNL